MQDIGYAPNVARITALRLQTGPFAAMRDFYASTIGLPISEETDCSVVFQVGDTELTFAQNRNGEEPFYHFAFNIPENQIEAAREWQLQRTTLMPIPDSLQSKNHSPGIVEFANWNAHALYFYDPAGNVVEYIARHDLPNASQEPFDANSLLCTSEIAFIVDDVQGDGDRITQAAGVRQYGGGDDQFRAMGDPEGLLLIMKRGRTINFKPDDPLKASRVFSTSVTVRAAENCSLRFNDYPYDISATL